MSHYVKVTTQYRDLSVLSEALSAIWPKATISLTSGRRVVGYEKVLGPTCQLIVAEAPAIEETRKRQNGDEYNYSSAGPLYGELGFRTEADGTLSMHCDHLDMPALELLPQDYARRVATYRAQAEGWTVTEQTTETGEIVLNLEKW